MVGTTIHLSFNLHMVFCMRVKSIQDVDVPSLGLGTWKLKGDDCIHAVEHALSIGYRHIDTAQAYENEAQVGSGMQRSGVNRDEIFLTTKIMPEKFEYDTFVEAVDNSLQRLKSTHADLLLLHWPNQDLPVSEPLGAMIELRQAGKIRHIGVSNFTPTMVQ